MAQFEEKLGKWELAELELGRALEQVQARQGTVDALQADIKHMFDMAERTVRDVRGIATAQKEIEASRASLDAVLARIKDADSAMSSLDDRKRQIEQAEDRLARAEALLIGIQSSLETLQGQKALVDHVVEKAGSLTFQTKHAEALIDRLREEREITSRVRSAVEELRRGDEKPKSQAKAS
jgi:DNA repair exonuclease SbcCD ATPase subunit